MHKSRMAALALVLPALALGACGSDSDSSTSTASGSSDKDQITEIITSVAAEPSKLCDLMSDEFLETTFKGSVEDCRAAAEGEEGGTADIETLDVNGDTATATVSDDTGENSITFKKVDGAWTVSDSQ